MTLPAPIVSVFPPGSIRKAGVRPSSNIALHDLLEVACVSQEIARLCDELRAAAQEFQQDAKARLPFFLVSGIFELRNEFSLLTPAYLLHLDFDKLDSPRAARQILQADPHCYACFKSPSGDGLKWFCRVNIPPFQEPSGKWSHLPVYLQLIAYMAEKYSFKPDPACKDVPRACYLSYDEELYLNADAQVFMFDPAQAAPAQPAMQFETNGGVVTIAQLDAASDDETRAAYLRKCWFAALKMTQDDGRYFVDGQRNHFIYTVACKLNRFGVSLDEALYRITQYATEQGYGGRKEQDEWATTVRKAYKQRAAEHARDPLRIPSDPAPKDELKETVDAAWNDQRGLAELLARQFGGWYLYDHTTKGWLKWLDGVYVENDKAQIRPEAQRYLFARIERAINAGPDSEKTLEMLRKLKAKINTANYFNNVMRLFQDQPEVAAQSDDFDNAETDWLLNCRNGVLDLRTWQFRPHLRTDRFRRQAACEYDPEAVAGFWEMTLLKLFNCDDELIDYAQGWAGACLCGGQPLGQVFLYAVGGGGRGKSTFFRALEMVLGSYFASLDVEFLLAGRINRADEMYNWAALQGKRLVVAPEVPPGRAFNTGVIKRLTGGDAIAARQPGGRVFNLRPSFRLAAFGNDYPEILEAGDGVWRRMIPLEFRHKLGSQGDVVYADDETDRLFQAELAGILNWMIAGLKLVQAGRWRKPDAVQAAADDYRAGEDALAEFLDKYLIAQPGTHAPMAEVFAEYGAWCKLRRRRQEYPKDTRLRKALEERGYRTERYRNNYRAVIDIALKTVPRSETEAYVAVPYQEKYERDDDFEKPF